MDKHNLNERYGKNIVKIRQARGMSQTEFVNRSEYSRTTIQDLESGAKGITTGNLLKVSEILGVQPYELLVDTKDIPENIYSKLQKLSERDLTMILKLVEFMESNSRG